MAIVSFHFYSRYLAHQTQVCVALPEISEDPLPESYPVLYPLHGRGDKEPSRNKLHIMLV